MLTVSVNISRAEPHTTVDCEEMNSGALVEWLPKDALPAHDTGEIKLATPHCQVKIVVTTTKD
jgi:hypothetical protein